MQQARGGMGSHKHGTSGRPPRSPRYKFLQQLEANREAEQRRPRTELKYSTPSEAFKHKGK